MFTQFADNSSEKSVASQLRQKRLHMLLDMCSNFPKQVSILDIGGRPIFWEKIFQSEPILLDKLHLTLVNPNQFPCTHPNIISLVADGRDLSQFSDNQFDIVFSNSTIEHVGTFEDQKRMADEVSRLGKKHFIQTPNLYFPIEPHFVFPFFQFLPIGIRALLVHNLKLGWYAKAPTRQDAIDWVSSIRLLSKQEFQELFPTSNIYEEKFYGLTKSFVAHNA